MLDSQGKPKKSELPSTIRRSGKKARRTFAKAWDSAMDQYHDEERSYRVAYAALKHTHEKVGDKWKKKPKSERSGEQHRSGDSKEHLYELAQELDIEGRSTMSKEELQQAIQKENDRRTRESSS